MKLDPTENGFAIEAVDLADLFDREPSEVRRMMHEGTLTSRFERGEGEDAGRYRVTFQDGARRVRLILDASGRVIKRTRVPLAGRNLS